MGGEEFCVLLRDRRAPNRRSASPSGYDPSSSAGNAQRVASPSRNRICGEVTTDMPFGTRIGQMADTALHATKARTQPVGTEGNRYRQERPHESDLWKYLDPAAWALRWPLSAILVAVVLLITDQVSGPPPEGAAVGVIGRYLRSPGHDAGTCCRPWCPLDPRCSWSRLDVWRTEPHAGRRHAATRTDQLPRCSWDYLQAIGHRVSMFLVLYRTCAGALCFPPSLSLEAGWLARVAITKTALLFAGEWLYSPCLASCFSAFDGAARTIAALGLMTSPSLVNAGSVIAGACPIGGWWAWSSFWG